MQQISEIKPIDLQGERVILQFHIITQIINEVKQLFDGLFDFLANRLGQ